MMSKALADAEEIWGQAKEAGKERYVCGRDSHKTDLWTAGAGWYAQQAREEAIDAVAYHHHLQKRIRSIEGAAKKMLAGELSRTTGAKLILAAIGGEPKKSPQRRNRE
jgi:hypothetical protein